MCKRIGCTTKSDCELEMERIICIKCKINFQKITKTLSYDCIDKNLNIKTILLPNITILKCPQCGQLLYPENLQKKLKTQYKKVK